jgi:hypothetical protein
MHGCRGLLAILAVAMGLAYGVPAWGESSDPIEQARALMRERQVSAAIEVLVPVVHDDATSAATRVHAMELIATCLQRKGKIRASRQAIERLLDLDPGYDLQEERPPRRFRKLFRRTKRSYAPSSEVESHVQVADQFPEEGGPLRLVIIAEAPAAGVDRAVAYVRPAGADAFHPTVMSRSGLEFSVELDPPEEEGRDLEVYVELQAPSGHVIGGRWTEHSPQVVEAPPPRPVTRWYASWWFWTLVGVVVAGTTTAAVWLSIPQHQDGTLGSMEAP